MDKWAAKVASFYKVQAPTTFMQYIVLKGYIAIDGASETVCAANSAELWSMFALIQYTQMHYVAPDKAISDKVSVGIEVMSKIVQRLLRNARERMATINEQLGLPINSWLMRARL